MTLELSSALLLGIGSFSVALVALYLTQRRAVIAEPTRLQERMEARFDELEHNLHQTDNRVIRIEATWQVLSDHLPKIARRGQP
jgi:hypothetical protein